MSTRTLDGDYLSALEHHLAEDEEAGLLRAYELGRSLMEDGAGLLDVLRVHANALAELRRRRDHAAHARLGESFLTEVLAPYEMAYLGFQEANASLRQMTASLEEEVAARTRELEESLGSLQRVDAERRRLLERVVSAQEKERHRIANDLHDDTIQVMTAVGIRLSTLSGLADDGDDALIRRLEKTVSDAIERLRRLVFELRPPALDHSGLAAAIRLYIDTVFDDAVEYAVEDRRDDEPPSRVRETAYRIAQEALANVRRHADATLISVRIGGTRTDLQVRIEDDGAGFDPAQVPPVRPGHLGISAMRDRAEMVGGNLQITSARGAGTCVEFWLPVAGSDPSLAPTSTRHGDWRR